MEETSSRLASSRRLVLRLLSNWRVIVLAVLLVIPLLVLAGTGAWYYWSMGWSFFVWWPLAGCLATAYLLGWWWQRKSRLLPPVEFAPPPRWTARDQEAWRLVEARAKAAKDIPAERFTQAPFYLEIVQSMANELAHFYHPTIKDPVEALTIPEILAVAELASHDLAEMVDEYLPGGHVLTIRNWRQASQITDWYTRASNVYWAISALFSPLNTAVRYSASKLGLSRPLQMLQANVLAWFYTAFVQRVGTYLIDLNSGRLRVGARRYRELMAEIVEAAEPPALPATELPPAAEPAVVRETTLTILGRVKAGKSSLINALLGERKAATDVLPLTNAITKYQLQAPGVPARLALLDTVGYGNEGPKADQMAATSDAVQQSDLVLLVLHVRDPARQPDLDMLRQLRAWFAARPHLKMPPVVAVVTHIDLLSPLMDWAPPYDWLSPKRAKERSIHDAITVVRNQLGELLVDVIPVCTAEGRVSGVQEALLPVIVERIGEARAVALLRCLHAEADAGRVRKVFEQLLEAGKQLVKAALSGG